MIFLIRIIIILNLLFSTAYAKLSEKEIQEFAEYLKSNKFVYIDGHIVSKDYVNEILARFLGFKNPRILDVSYTDHSSGRPRRRHDYFGINRRFYFVTRVTQAIFQGNLAAVKSFSVFDLNEIVHDDGSTALHFAALNGRVDIVRVLIEKYKAAGIDIDRENAFEETALHLAAYAGSYQVAAYLISHGANPEYRNYELHTPLMYAIKAYFDNKRKKLPTTIIKVYSGKNKWWFQVWMTLRLLTTADCDWDIINNYINSFKWGPDRHSKEWVVSAILGALKIIRQQQVIRGMLAKNEPGVFAACYAHMLLQGLKGRRGSTTQKPFSRKKDFAPQE